MSSGSLTLDYEENDFRVVWLEKGVVLSGSWTCKSEGNYFSVCVCVYGGSAVVNPGVFEPELLLK